MKEILESIIPDVPTKNKSYLGDDGLLHCAVCHERIERFFSVPELNLHRKVGCICACERAKLEEEKARDRIMESERKRSVCFMDSNMNKWTFDRDDRKNPKISDAMQNYVKNFDEFRKTGKGLLLYGTVGTGKTYLGACIANALIDEGMRCLFRTFKQIERELWNADNKAEYMKSLSRYPLIVFDDLGAERESKYMSDIVFDIIDTRYKSGLPFIITTNLTAEEIKKPDSVAHTRIYDRILERCHPIKFEGNSRRRENLKDGFADTQKLLGL